MRGNFFNKVPKLTMDYFVGYNNLTARAPGLVNMFTKGNRMGSVA